MAFATELVGPEPGQLERLRALPAKELAEAYANKRVGDSGWQVNFAIFGYTLSRFDVVLTSFWVALTVNLLVQGFYPVIDPSEDVIPASPFEIFRQGGQARVPIMV